MAKKGVGPPLPKPWENACFSYVPLFFLLFCRPMFSDVGFVGLEFGCRVGFSTVLVFVHFPTQQRLAIRNITTCATVKLR